MSQRGSYGSSKARRFCWIAILFVAVLAGIVPALAKPVDPLVEEGVRISIEKQKIAHLERTGQIEHNKAQALLEANSQKWNEYKQGLARWPKEKQQAHVERLKQRYAEVFPAIQQQWANEAQHLQKGAKPAESRKEPARPPVKASPVERPTAQREPPSERPVTRPTPMEPVTPIKEPTKSSLAIWWHFNADRFVPYVLLATLYIGLLLGGIVVAYRRQPAGESKVSSFRRFAQEFLKSKWKWVLAGAVIAINANWVAKLVDELGRLFYAALNILTYVGAMAVFVYVQYRRQPEGNENIRNLQQFGLKCLKDNWKRIAITGAVWIYAGPMWGSLTLVATYAGPYLKILDREERNAEKKVDALAKTLAEQYQQWMTSLGATHAERAKAINAMFDRKDKTLSIANLISFDSRDAQRTLGTKKRHHVHFGISRNLATMPPRERELLRALELIQSLLKEKGKDTGTSHGTFYGRMKAGLLWGDGKARIDTWEYDVEDVKDKGIRSEDSSSVVKWSITRQDASVEQVATEVLSSLEKAADDKETNPETAKLVQDILRRFRGGNQWMSAGEIQGTAFEPKSEYTLRIGMLDDAGHELTYSGEGCMISIAPPGSGKTQCNVFPNLLNWRGPAVVLDVKGEIYGQTSKWRSEHVGPVYKFSPLDPANSHCYNPLSFIRQEADYIWEDSRFLADMMIVPSGGSDPFWENKARDVLTSAIAHVCYLNGPDQRPMSKIVDIVHGGQPWDEMVVGLQAASDVRSMVQSGTSLSTISEKTRDSILQTAQSSLSAWTGERIGRVTQKSDWSPLDLRSGKNPTIYICLKPSEVESYTSALRVFIAQHIRMLTNELPPHGAAPILFLLDELPRLRHMPPVEEAIEIGRQYGLRLWMFAQSLGQLKNAYPNAEGMVGSCAVRIFMNPSSHDGTAEKLSEEMGYRESALDGSRVKVVEATELAGPNFKDYQLVMASSCKPVKVKKAFAWQDPELKSRMGSL